MGYSRGCGRDGGRRKAIFWVKHLLGESHCKEILGGLNKMRLLVSWQHTGIFLGGVNSVYSTNSRDRGCVWESSSLGMKWISTGICLRRRSPPPPSDFPVSWVFSSFICWQHSLKCPIPKWEWQAGNAWLEWGVKGKAGEVGSDRK